MEGGAENPPTRLWELLDSWKEKPFTDYSSNGILPELSPIVVVLGGRMWNLHFSYWCRWTISVALGLYSICVRVGLVTYYLDLPVLSDKEPSPARMTNCLWFIQD